MSWLGWTERLMPHLMLAPLLLPMLTAALMLTLGEKHQRTKLLMNISACVLNVVVAIALVHTSQFLSLQSNGGWALELQALLLVSALAVAMGYSKGK